MHGKERHVFFHLAGAIIFLSLPVLFSPDFSESFRLLRIPPFQRDFLGYAFVLLFFYLNYYLLLPRLYFRNKHLVYIAAIVASYVVVAFLPYLLIPAHPMHVGMPGGPRHPDNTFMHMLGQHLFQFLIVLVFSLLLKFNNRLKMAEEEKFRAELSYLRAQINPHFLFNTLNGIYSLAIEKSDKTPEAIVDLSNLMRYVTTEAHRNLVPLDNEIVYLTNYINLQAIRLGETTKIDYKLSGRMDNQQIAPLILVPFVENAFKYGINPEWNTFIKILIEVNNGELRMNVFNLVVNEDKSGSGCGVANAKNRLEAIYPNKYSLLIIDEKSEYTVDLKIKLND